MTMLCHVYYILVLVLFISIFRVGVMSHMIMPINIKIFNLDLDLDAYTVYQHELLSL